MSNVFRSNNYSNEDLKELRVAYAESYTNFGGNLAANATVGVKSGAGHIHSVSVNTKAGGAQKLVVVDNVSGASTPTIGTIDVQNNAGPFLQGAKFATGLTYYFSASAASSDVTISYR